MGKLLLFLLIFVILGGYYANSQESDCDYSVQVLLENEEFMPDEFTWKMKAVKVEGIAANITGRAEIRDLEDNIIKTYKPWTNKSISRQKTSSKYTPNLKSGQYRVISAIFVDCIELNLDNNIAEAYFTIKEGFNDQIQETKIYPIKEQQESYEDKKNTESENKSLSLAPIDNAIEENQKGAEPENNELKVTDEISHGNKKKIFNEIESNSNDKKIGGKEGIGEISGNYFEEGNVIYLNENTNKKQEMPSKANDFKDSETIFISSDEKSKNTIIYFLLFISVILNVFLIWKK
jgi:hypothetical protein